MKEIKKVGKQIADEFKPERIVLFGSHAEGKSGKDSDVDLLIILPFKGKSFYKSAEIRAAIRTSFPIDLIVRSPLDIQKRIKMGDPFFRDILEKGKLIYEAPNA
mgnify:CR=1 FL=1